MAHCIYCNSTSYGKPCLFSPSKSHVHFDSPEKCIYCGSRVLGGGCLLNPFGKTHIRGPEYLLTVKEQCNKSLILTYLYEKLNKINKNVFLTPLNRFYQRLYQIISSTSQPLLEAFNIQTKPTYTNLSKKQNILVFELKEKIKKNKNELFAILKEANTQLPEELVEEMLIDVIISSDEKKNN
jgi:hypothetical protein